MSEERDKEITGQSDQVAEEGREKGLARQSDEAGKAGQVAEATRLEIEDRTSKIEDSPSTPLPLESSNPPSPELVFDLPEAVETLLFASEGPLPTSRIAELTGRAEDAIGEAVGALNLSYEQTGRTFRIHKLALGFQFYTLPEHISWVRQLYRRQFTHRLSAPALEVLAIVAYKQPVTRPEIESLRGVDCAGPLVTLLERRLITTAGRAHKPGSPFLYRTTREFLRYFGLESLDHLPPLDELGAFLANAQAAGDGEVQDTLAIGSPRGLGPGEKEGDREIERHRDEVAEEEREEKTEQDDEVIERQSDKAQEADQAVQPSSASIEDRQSEIVDSSPSTP